MSQAIDPVFDRSVLPEGKVFIKANEESSRAYVIQTGLVRSFSHDEDGKEVEIGRFGPGTIIGEVCLVIDDLIPINYEAVETTTVITITRQDFQKKFAKADNVIQTILTHLTEKLAMHDGKALEKAMSKPEIDPTAAALVKSLTKSLPEERKAVYSEAILPHVNGLITAIKEMKRETGVDQTRRL